MNVGVSGDEEDPTMDVASWPTNRLSYRELREQDTLKIHQLFHSRSDTPLLMKWVMIHKCGSKFRSRIFVVSALRVCVLKHKKTFREALVVRQEFQLMHIQKLVVLCSDPFSSSSPGSSSTVSLQLVIVPQRAKEKSKTRVMLHLDPGVHTEKVVRLLQRQFHALRLAFPQRQMPLVKLPPDCHWYECFSDSSTSANQCSLDQNKEETSGIQKPDFAAMAMAYHAFCDDLGVRVCATLPIRLEECATTSGCMDYQYCLGFPDRVDGFDHRLEYTATPLYDFACSVISKWFPGLKSSYLLIEIQALTRMLECSRCFRDILICDLALGPASWSLLFHALLSPCCAIEGFTLTNVQLSVQALRVLQQVVLESTMRQPKNDGTKVRLQRLDLSFNCFTLTMATELSTIIQLLPNGLEFLHLERCGLTSVACCRVLDALTTSSAFATSLVELNIAGNHLGLDGTVALASWITRALALQRLDVSRTQLETNVFMHALQQNSLLHESLLQQLDLSYNYMRTHASEELGVILGKSHSLGTLFLRGMKRYRHFHKVVPHQREQHKALGTLSRVALEAQVAATRRTGGYRAYGLRKRFLKNILAPMFSNTDRSGACMVDLSQNDLSGHRAEVLAHLLEESLWSTRFSLRLDYTSLHDKAALLLLHSISKCTTLYSLSLEGNGFVKRQAHRKRQWQNETCYRNGVMPSEPSMMEQAGANALARLVGGTFDSNNNQLANRRGTKDTTAASAALSLALKPLRLSELCLKSKGSYVFGTHIITAAVQALGQPCAYLQMLDVTGNECGDALAQVLGDVLPKNTSLQALFWDGNWTTVEGFSQFHDGLLNNQTLVVVQMPIKDTRRILEEQKDPPRKELFNLLGKIFKATERNQSLQREIEERKAKTRTLRQHTSEPSVCVPAALEQEIELSRRGGEVTATMLDDSLKNELQYELKSTGLALQQCLSPKLAPIDRDDKGTHFNCTRKSYSRSTGARYPSTIQSWNMQRSTDDNRFQL